MPKLLDPLSLGSLHLKNRIVMPPMAFGLSNEKGEVTEKLINHYSDRCQDVGLVIVEATNVSHNGRIFKRQLNIADENNQSGFIDLVDEVHKKGSKAALQLVHAGGAAPKELVGRPLAPSAVVIPELYETVPDEMGPKEIDDVVEDFIKAAVRAYEAGFDAVEVHGAHGYLLNQFLSPLTNQRVDSFGGTLEDRMRVPLRVVEGIKRKLGVSYSLFYRLGAEDIMEGGLKLEEGILAAQLLVQYGVDVLDISGGVGSSLKWLDKQSGSGFLIPQAAAVKAVVGVPVIGVGGIKTAKEAESIIRSDYVDLVAIGRALLKDPQWATKAVTSLK
jgi:NADPH2 dehydrogenase